MTPLEQQAHEFVAVISAARKTRAWLIAYNDNGGVWVGVPLAPYPGTKVLFYNAAQKQKKLDNLARVF